MTPMERAARALHAESQQVRFIRDPLDPDVVHRRPASPVAWDDLTDGTRRTYFDQVHTVLTAIREPSDAMIEAGRISDPLGYCDVADEDVRMLYTQTFQGMIDAALAEEG